MLSELLRLFAPITLGLGPVYAQEQAVSYRGLSAVSADVAWISGSRGTIVRGAARHAIPDAQTLDFRAIAAFDERTGVAAATAGRIYRTADGGRSWQLVYRASDTTVFLDAIAFWPGTGRGLVLGDPMDGRFLLLSSSDSGRTWRDVPAASRPIALPGEGAFAASGTSLVMHGTSHVWIGTGVKAARVLHSRDGGVTWSAAVTPLQSSTESAGVFSLSFADTLHGIAVGGDYANPDARDSTVAITHDGGATWTVSRSPLGFRSAVAIVPGTAGRVAIAVGTRGVDRTTDGGVSWTPVDTTGYHVVRFAPDGGGWAAGPRGRIARVRPDGTLIPH